MQPVSDHREQSFPPQSGAPSSQPTTSFRQKYPRASKAGLNLTFTSTLPVVREKESAFSLFASSTESIPDTPSTATSSRVYSPILSQQSAISSTSPTSPISMRRSPAVGQKLDYYFLASTPERNSLHPYTSSATAIPLHGFTSGLSDVESESRSGDHSCTSHSSKSIEENVELPTIFDNLNIPRVRVRYGCESDCSSSCLENSESQEHRKSVEEEEAKTQFELHLLKASTTSTSRDWSSRVNTIQHWLSQTSGTG